LIIIGGVTVNFILVYFIGMAFAGDTYVANTDFKDGSLKIAMQKRVSKRETKSWLPMGHQSSNLIMTSI
jgi:hypothetical protein